MPAVAFVGCDVQYKILVAPERGDVNEVDRGVCLYSTKEVNPSVTRAS